MAKLIEMDEQVTIFSQIEEDAGPVILINKFSVDDEEFDHRSFSNGKLIPLNASSETECLYNPHKCPVNHFENRLIMT
jgi:hypothetical protein